MRWDMRCEQCAHVVEVHQRPSANQEIWSCPKCGGAMWWVPTPTAFVVKGFNEGNGYSNATKKT